MLVTSMWFHVPIQIRSKCGMEQFDLMKAVHKDNTKDSSTSLSNSTTKEDVRLLDTQGVILYKRRWYVLLVFSYAALVQSAIWNTFGPIAQSAKLVFGWTDANVGMLTNWGNIMYFIFMIPIAWVMDVKGLRVSLLLCVTLIMAGATIRCFSTDPTTATWLINVASIINGIGGTVPFAGPALLSVTWFPPTQRATATAISTVFGYAGMSVAFIIGPLLVPEPETTVSIPDINLFNVSDIGNYSITSPTDIDSISDNIMRLFYIECGAAILLFLLVLVYFPAKPPSPPTVTASIERTPYTQGLKQLFRHRGFLLILFAYSIPTGVYGVFGTVLNVILNGVHISQKTTGWLGFYSTIGGCAAQLLLARMSDHFLRHMKLILLFLYVMATASTLWFVLQQIEHIIYNIASLYAACTLIGIFIMGSVPLFYEVGCEASYPIAEGVTAGVLTLINNLTGIIFLSVLQIPNIGVMWMNWALLGSVVVTLPLLLVFKEKYTRTDIDTTSELIVPPPAHAQTKSLFAEENTGHANNID